ncbi:MAG TPA: glycosyltransferase family 39 protein [Methylomirabilota bacterium]|jgi:hypothetical protein
MPSEDRRRPEALWLLLALVLALALRVSAAVEIRDGRLAFLGCEEPFTQQLQSVVESGNPLRHRVFFYPPVPAMITGMGTLAWWKLGGGGSLGTVCRTFGLGVSLATVAVVYMVGRLWGPRHGAIAALLYAVTMIAAIVQVNVQAYSTLFLWLALYAALRASASGGTLALTLAGVFLGLAIASKYSPVLFAGVFVAVQIVLLRRSAPSPAGAPPAIITRLLGRVWVMLAALAVVVAVIVLWFGLVQREATYALFQRLYDRGVHANSFEYHRPWIDRMFGLALVAAAAVGAGSVLALGVPMLARSSPVAWATWLSARLRALMIPAAAVAATLAIVLALPVAVNLGDYLSHLAFLTKSHAAGDHGMFPAVHPAVPYFTGFLPENLGVPIFVAGLLGMAYALARRDVKFLILMVAVIPAYMALELTRVKVNRFALELTPLWCLGAALWLGDLMLTRGRVLRVAGVAITVAVVVYSSLYAQAWAEFMSPRSKPQAEAGAWIQAHVPAGASLGMKSRLLLDGSPQLVPDVDMLRAYRITDYTEAPDYAVIPGSIAAIVELWDDERARGHRYTANDWYPSTPSDAELDALARILRGDGYVLEGTFASRVAVAHIDVPSNSLGGRTWFAEHNSACGVRIYRRVKASA